jgi:hypothetical protein
VGDVVVTDHQHVGDLLELGVPHALAELVVGVDDVDACIGGSETIGNVCRVFLVCGRDR